MSSLYKLTGEMLHLFATLENDGGEMTLALAQQLAYVEQHLQEKAGGYCSVLANFQGQIAAVDAELERLKAMRSVAENAVKRLKARLYDAMTVLGLDSIDAGLWKLRICKNPRPSFTWDGTNPPPAEYQRVSVEVDKDKLYQDWKAGKELPSQVTVTQGTNLRIT